MRALVSLCFTCEMERDEFNGYTGQILDAAIAVHKAMGPGLLEAVYHHCMVHELRSRGLDVDTMVMVPLFYKDTPLDKQYIIDILVCGEIILELKAVEVVLPVHKAQIISYLKLADKRLGLLLNFNVTLMRDGFMRFVNKL
jgi:GxxExxY protein